MLADFPPAALRCSARYRGNYKADGIDRRRIRLHSVLTLLPSASSSSAEGNLKGSSDRPYEATLLPFGSPCGAPSNADQPGAVGEHYLSRAAASCAAARLVE